MRKKLHLEEKSLFRKEAIAARKDSALGNSVSLKPIAATLIVIAVLTIVILTLLFLTLGKYTGKIRAIGFVQPSSGITQIYATKAGYITNIKIKENSEISTGSPLLVIESEDKTALGDTRESLLDQLENQKKELEKEINIKLQQKISLQNSLTQEINYSEKYLKILAEQIAQHNSYLKKMYTIYKTYQQYEKRGLISKKDLLYRYETYQSIKKEGDELEKEKNNASQKLRKSQNELQSTDINSAAEISEIKEKMFSISSKIIENESLRRSQLLSPSSGMITSILFHQNQYVAMGTPLLSIIPSSPELDIHLFVKSSQIGRIKEGAKVSIRYYSYPHQKFGIYSGVIINVSKSPVSDELSTVTKEKIENYNDETFRIIVKPDKNHVTAHGKDEPIIAGMKVEADILLETRNLYEWIFEPILGHS